MTIEYDNSPGGKGRVSWLAAALLLVSAAALVVEILAGRMLAPYVGMSLYTWTGVIACVLAGLSAGHWLGGRLDPGDRIRTEARIGTVLATAALAVGASPWLLRATAPILLDFADDPVTAVSLLALAVFFAPSFMAGLLSPMLTRLALDAQPDRPSRVLGRMYAAGAIGGIAGTVAAGFLLLSWLGSAGTALSVTALYACLALVFLASARRVGTLGLPTAALACVGMVLAAAATFGRQQVCDIESNYYCLRVVDHSHETGRASALLVIDHMGHGINDRDEPRWIHTSYAALTDRLLRLRGVARRPFRALFVGGGAYTLPRAWRASFPQARLTVAEVDPAVTRVARERLWLGSTGDIEIHHADARDWLNRAGAGRRFDVICGDAFHDLSVPAHLMTLEFAALVRERLQGPGSFYALTVIDSALRPAMLPSVAYTLEQVFSEVEIWADEAQWRAGGRLTYLVLAANERTPGTQITGRAPDDAPANRRWIQLGRDWLSEHGASAVLLTDDHAPVDRLMYAVSKAALSR